MAIISGIFTDPFGTPLSNVTLRLLARTNTSVTFTGTNAAAVTAADGSYSMSVLVGLYAVSAIINRQEDYLGVIQVYPDSPDGTLNEYLACFNPDDVTPAILIEMELLVAEAKAAAAAAEYYAEIAKEYALIPRGPYEPTVSYAENDLVEFDGSEYRATAEVSAIAPPASPWQLFVSKGDTGEKGEAGDTGDEGPVGPANTLTIGTVSTVAPGQPAAAEITGDAPDQTLNLSIPQGAQGEQGEAGAKGDTGPANTLAIGVVTTVAPDQPAAATITGDAPNQTLNLNIPQGLTGEVPDFTVDGVGLDENNNIPLNAYTPDNPPPVSIPVLGEPGSSGSFMLINISTAQYPGTTFPAAQVYYAGVNDGGNLIQGSGGHPAAGTWELRGYAQPSSTSPHSFVSMTRIDTLAATMRGAVDLASLVRNLMYSSADNSTIDCELYFRNTWHPFTASPKDPMWWGREIYAAAVAGAFGEVAAYVVPGSLNF